MPSPRKAPPSHAAETEMPSGKKEVTAPSKSLGKTQVKRVRKWRSVQKANPKAEWPAPSSTRGGGRSHHRAMPRLGRIASVEFVDRASMRPDGDVHRRENECCAQPSLDTDGGSTAFFIPSIIC